MSTYDETPADQAYITVAEAAELLDITENAVRKRIHRNSLPAEKEGRDWRIRVADLDAERIIDVDAQAARSDTGRPPTGHSSQQDDQQRDKSGYGSLRDVPHWDANDTDGQEQDGSQEAGRHRDNSSETAGAATEPEPGLRLAERQLAIFVDQFVRPKDQRIAELERQLGRLEAETEILANERSNVRQLERENGQLSERIRQLEGELQQHAADDDQQRDIKPWWQFWK